MTYGLFKLPVSYTNSNSDLDSKPNGYIVLRKIFHILILIPILTAN